MNLKDAIHTGELIMEFLNDVLIVFSVPLVLVYVVVPILFTVAPDFMQHAFFLSFVANPFADFKCLKKCGIRSEGRNFYLKNGKKIKKEATEDAVRAEAYATHPRIGVWHILPASVSSTLKEKEPSDDELEKLMDFGLQPIVIYNHGNSFDRSTIYRCEMYNTLSDLDFHVLTYDYRGYGDSLGTPTEDGLNDDARSVYRYAREVAPSKQVIIWGHSMGTGVATRMVSELCDEKSGPDGLVLESPFNNLRDVIRRHPFSMPLRFLPCFDEIIIFPLMKIGLIMATDKRITKITCPILIMHSQDDHIIPVDLARKLVECAKNAKLKVTYVEFEEERDYKHKFIYRAPELPKILRDFVMQCKKLAMKK